MFNKTVLFSLILSLTSVALAQERVQPNPTTMRVEADSPQATQTCRVTYTSGTSNTATQFCVTVNGNIPQFSVRNLQLFPPTGNAADLEGYGICDQRAKLAYYDYAAFDSGDTGGGLWNASTLQQNGNKVTVTRTTKDGNWQLTQTIVNVPATASTVGSAKVTMKLKNLSSVGRGATLLRYAAEAFPGGNNTYSATLGSASGQGENAAGLMITGNYPPGFVTIPYVQNIQSGPNPCSPFDQEDTHLPYVGLGSIVAVWFVAPTIPPGGVATVTSIYRGF
jgi:hypothetical protein